MNKGVDILLQRMESNPDEFASDHLYGGYPKKWASILEKVQMRVASLQDPARAEMHYKYQLPFLSDDDILAVWAKLNDIHGDQFTKQVMGILLAEEEEVPETLRYQSNNRYGSGNYHSSSSLGNTIIGTQAMRNQASSLLRSELDAAFQQQQLTTQMELAKQQIAQNAITLSKKTK